MADKTPAVVMSAEPFRRQPVPFGEGEPMSNKAQNPQTGQQAGKEPLPERDTRKPQERNPDKIGQTAGVRQNTHNQGYQQDR
jgi:hypothetical protein